MPVLRFYLFLSTTEKTYMYTEKKLQVYNGQPTGLV